MSNPERKDITIDLARAEVAGIRQLLEATKPEDEFRRAMYESRLEMALERLGQVEAEAGEAGCAHCDDRGGVPACDACEKCISCAMVGDHEGWCLFSQSSQMERLAQAGISADAPVDVADLYFPTKADAIIEGMRTADREGGRGLQVMLAALFGCDDDDEAIMRAVLARASELEVRALKAERRLLLGSRGRVDG